MAQLESAVLRYEVESGPQRLFEFSPFRWFRIPQVREEDLDVFANAVIKNNPVSLPHHRTASLLVLQGCRIAGHQTIIFRNLSSPGKEGQHRLEWIKEIFVPRRCGCDPRNEPRRAKKGKDCTAARCRRDHPVPGRPGLSFECVRSRGEKCDCYSEHRVAI